MHADEITAPDTREEITSFPNYPGYIRAWTVFKRRGFSASCGAVWRQDIETTLNKFLKTEPPQDIRVLSIGPGNGTMDEPLIDTLSNMTTSKVVYCAIDPDSAYLQEFRELAASRSDDWKNIEIEFRVESMEEYSDVWDKCEKKDKFNLIFASYVIYHFRDAKATLVKMNEMLENNGIMYFKIVSGGWSKLMAYWNKFYYDSSCKINRHSPELVKSMILDVMPNAKLQVLDRNADVDITECFEEGSENGKLMLDFLMQMKDFKSVASPERRDQLIQFLKDECCEAKGDRIMLSCTDQHVYFIK
ncbi:histamine N-methyltransferase-like [Saccoglossus kowalevskii]|uniref:Histamine N-methyltransferase-like n=1 Tax=Saccoglossus kowalevskii TaxID=10224 RepID=A0ABM0GMH0_SACKO|nr:PREDICTED: histamine N-methyltransferase-like [Saccoglossus kowalevskii]